MIYRPCLTPGCYTPTARKPAYCDTCGQQRDRARSAARPHYGPEWRRLSRETIAAQPWCTRCGATTDLTTDHIKPRGLADGVQVLCRSCNSSKGATQQHRNPQ